MNQNDLTPADHRDRAHLAQAQAYRAEQENERLLARGRDQASKLDQAERTNGVLRAANAHLRGKLDKYLLERDENRAVIARLEGEVNQARNDLDEVYALRQELAQIKVEREALHGIVHSLHERAVRATEALGVVYGPADAD